MRCDMQQTVQPSVSGAQSGATAAVGEFPDAETGFDALPDRADTPAQNDEIQPDTDNGRSCKTACGAFSIAGKLCNIPARVMIFFIRIYQLCISPWLPCRCRFTPTCSNYGVEAFKKHGFWVGSMLTVWRIMRCQPFCRGGYDPVPEKKTERK